MGSSTGAGGAAPNTEAARSASAREWEEPEPFSREEPEPGKLASS